MADENNEVLIEDDLDEEEVMPFKYSITSYGADYPVDGLVKRIGNGTIFIPPFQRGFVWSYQRASRFVESLLLGLPVPGIFLSKESETEKLLVIDGQQRLRTLQYFYEGIFADSGTEFALKGVQSELEGATYRSLPDEDRRRLDDSILHATIVKQDEPSDDDSSIYHIFERLNTGGMQLQSQEIRACIYHGDFNDLLSELNQDKDWRALFGPVHKRMRDQELILRFLALYFSGESYSKPMKEFLNRYMGRSKELQPQSADQARSVFSSTIRTIHHALGSNAFKPKRAIRAALFDAVAVGVARRLEQGEIQDVEELDRRYQALLTDQAFIDATEKSTADEESVRRRILLATEAFVHVE